MVSQLQRYLVLDSTEVINGHRTNAYLSAGLVGGWELPPCPPEMNYLLAAVPDAGYIDPATDPAPWYDTVDTASQHFFGVAPTSFSCDTGPLERVNVTSRRIGRLRTRTRRFTLECFLLADDCCGTDYGRRWLLSIFGVGCGNDFCARQTATLYVCEGPARYAYQVGLVSFEDISEGLECCFGMKARIVFDAEDPFFYGNSINLLSTETWPEAGSSGLDCVVWTNACTTIPDAACVPTVTSTISPPLLPSVAGPQAPGGTNVPWCEPLYQAHQCVSVDLSATLSAFGEAALRFTIDAGSADMINARIRIWPSAGGDCPAPDDQVDDPLAELDITFIPAGGTLIVDGASHTITMYCPEIGAYINADHLVYGPTGAFWRHPILGCDAAKFCVCASIDGENTAADATFTVDAIPRYL